MVPDIQLPSTKAVISAAASAAATVMLLRSFTNDFIPHELRQYCYAKSRDLFSAFSNEVSLVINEFDDLNKNQLFDAAKLYLSTVSSPSIKRFEASLPKKETKIHVSIAGNQEIVDEFCGFKLRWRLVTAQTQKRVPHPDEYHSSVSCEVRFYKLKFHKNHRSKVIDEYLPYILERSKAVKEGRKTLRLHTVMNERVHRVGASPWKAVNLDHPAKFETMAMDDEVKSMIMDDLDRFRERKEMYRRVGKAWKRGYLLFGPPGTGKSSLIAAMANYLNFDVYDLELTGVRCNSELRRLLISTANRSILVVEDIDASIDLTLSDRKKKTPSGSGDPFQHDQGPKVTLSGLLNFIDGLWSSCGDERIIIFTTNHKDKLDPALLRPGRMDVHIHMSYCTSCGFKMLAENYLGITGPHPLVSEAEGLIGSAKVTPAEVAEQLLKSDNPELALDGLIKFLKHKMDTDTVTKDDDLKAIPHGLEELMKIAQASPTDSMEQIFEKDEAACALKALIKSLRDEARTQNANNLDASSGPSAAV